MDCIPSTVGPLARDTDAFSELEIVGEWGIDPSVKKRGEESSRIMINPELGKRSGSSGSEVRVNEDSCVYKDANRDKNCVHQTDPKHSS